MRKTKYGNLEILSSLMDGEAFEDLERSVEVLRQQKLQLKKILQNVPQNAMQEEAVKNMRKLLEQVNGILVAVDRIN